MRALSGAALLAISAVGAQPDHSPQAQFDLAPKAIISARLEMVSRSLKQRRATLESLFQAAGCTGDHLSEQPVHGKGDSNVICTLPGEGAGTIVVGGHIDLVEFGQGAVDDWSGSVLLPSLYQGLKSKPRRHTFVFVGFTDEERGLEGSGRYVASLTTERKSAVRAMINLECLGMTEPEVWGSRADKRLLEYYWRMDQALGLPKVIMNVERFGDDDSHSFLRAHIPVLTIHTTTPGNLHILHSTDDNLKAINRDYYYDAYRLAQSYLAYLDTVLE